MNKKSRGDIIHSCSDRIFDKVNLVLMLLILVVMIWPLWFVVIASFSDSLSVSTGSVLLIPKGVTLAGYEKMLEYKSLWVGYGNTIIITLIGTSLNLFMTVCCAYPLSCKEFLPRKIVMYLLMVTMYFSGGMIPIYLVVKQLGLIDTRWAMIIPSAVSFYNCLIVRSYFINSIPTALKEAATLDGANASQYLIKVVVPLSKPVLAVVGLYYAVGHWNDYYSALLYIYDEKLYPLQSVLRNLLLSTQAIMTEGAVDLEELDRLYNLQAQMKYCVIIASIVPVLCIYPYIQKYFVKGVMVGSIKG